MRHPTQGHPGWGRRAAGCGALPTLSHTIRKRNRLLRLAGGSTHSVSTVASNAPQRKLVFIKTEALVLAVSFNILKH
jgi:hypothetical protein